jgi:hypothetical protein
MQAVMILLLFDGIEIRQSSGGYADSIRSNRFPASSEEQMNITQLTSLLSGGENIGGCQLSVSDAVALANVHFPSRAYCLVADWVILDIEVTTHQLKAITDRRLLPSLVYTLTVI